MNRGFCSSVGFKYELDCSCFRRDIQDSVFDSLAGEREGCLLAGSTQRRPVLASLALPRCPAVRRPDSTGPWCVRVLDSTGLHRIPFVRASEEMSRTVSSIRWRARGRVVSWPDRPDGVPSYPGPIPPRRPAMRRPDPTGP